MIKWKIIRDIDVENGNFIDVKLYSFLSKLGARFHPRPEIASYEFCLAYLLIGIQTRRLQESYHIKIHIPFMKLDKGLILRVVEEERSLSKKGRIFHNAFSRRK